MSESQQIAFRQILRKLQFKLLQIPGVVGIGIGKRVKDGKLTDELCLVFSVEKKLPASALSEAELVPRNVEGAPTDVQETGVFVANINRTGKHRPAPGGVSIGHKDITAGTLGCLVKDPESGQIYVLSNNHVLANSNAAAIGDAILQPGPADGGSMNDKIGILSDFVPINFGSNGGGDSDCPIGGFFASILNGLSKVFGRKTVLKPTMEVTSQTSNLVDAAISAPDDPSYVENTIADLGPISGLGAPILGLAVKKSGRTTGVTTGQILQTDVIAQVSYGAGKIAVFTDQVMMGDMSAGGDSGSVILDNDNKLVALLFAGSPTTTIASPINFVFSALNIELV